MSSRRQKRYAIYNANGEMLEGGFFHKYWAEGVRDRDYPGCVVKEQK